jgi:hypothetical protein
MGELPARLSPPARRPPDHRPGTGTRSCRRVRASGCRLPVSEPARCTERCPEGHRDCPIEDSAAAASTSGRTTASSTWPTTRGQLTNRTADQTGQPKWTIR